MKHLCWVVMLFTAAACGDDEPCNPQANTGCEDGLVCEEVTGGEPACFAPVVVRGDVFDLRGIARDEGALVVVRPDQYVAHVLPLDAHDELSAFFAPLLVDVAHSRETTEARRTRG